MKWSFDWQDLRLFLAVARGGGLARAAAETDLSPATLGRRMTALEQALEERLFVRGARGYALTEAGRSLLDRAADMETAAVDISRWRDGFTPSRRVRISAGDWTSQLIVDNIQHYWSPTDPWVPEFLAANARMDIARREADIGLRNRRPDAPWLAARRIGSVAYAAYRAVGADRDIGWIGIAGDAVLTPSARWTWERHAHDVTLTVNDGHLGLSLIRQGLGQMVLPCFVGNAYPDLTGGDEPIAELATEEWMAMHEADRHHPPIRAAIEALAGFLAREDRTIRGPAAR